MFPRSRTRVFSNESLRSVMCVVSRISSPMASVIYVVSLFFDWLACVLTSFSILTLALMPSTSASFCDSSDESTASE